MDFGDDQNAFFSLANVFTFAAAVALALPAKANTWPLRQQAVVWLVKTNFMWWKMTVFSGSHRQKI